MTFLLDTHTFLWFINDDPALSVTAKVLIEDPQNDVYLSIASLWEIAIKVSLQRLEIPHPFVGFLNEQLQANSIRLLHIKPEHVGIVSELPFFHRDPFDRLMIAQSLYEKLPIIGKDLYFDLYAIDRFW